MKRAIRIEQPAPVLARSIPVAAPMEPLMDIRAVAQFLGVSVRCVYNLKKLRYSKIAGCRRYQPADVRLYVSLNTNNPIQQVP